jgi:hypothetical protein
MKKKDRAAISGDMDDDKVRLREEIALQISALEDMKIM